MQPKKTERLDVTELSISRAAALLQAGGLVALPTETVYGLGADARNGTACAGIYEAKGRPSFNPLIVHVADVSHARHFAVFSDVAEVLAATFWPGPLTLVLPLRPDAVIASLVTAGLHTVAIRVPRHPVTRDLLAAFGGPIAAPSANPSGRISATTPDHVIDGLDGRIDAVIEAGASSVGVESTIISCVDTPMLLRQGGLPVSEIEAVLDRPIGFDTSPATLAAPGQLASHYAPKGRVRLNANHAIGDEILLGFGDVTGDLTLSETGDLVEAARVLFRRLHELDAMGATAIAVAPIPEHGLGAAINDRLRRAAAPRP
ncbi:L-threonylcarbamoyladenylate synthase [Thalassobium sp. R2A62]|jgi:L-threonylcarbamoyladenylate synthase|uniref:L-threonylcarbamoyladenylate synthase n=1 Tax=Thalassobium sp. R2A62 TaxID=633131 RepID=UPI00067FFE3C|nr:L-threonylcarbamoyladenylate synthase [Thalassobium sp. R2A62]MDG1340357.1 L-threonylcarbamoyladenylate synthase [Paracoccaceae bacterium]MDG1802918.1 L-threonylcarbamoyladenylate synthase [Paracoccaceae bacterium]MDG2452157.1 L-threonylcarbamoyladenylate synthase [Paracoccaceae bacterium]